MGCSCEKRKQDDEIDIVISKRIKDEQISNFNTNTQLQNEPKFQVIQYLIKNDNLDNASKISQFSGGFISNHKDSMKIIRIPFTSDGLIQFNRIQFKSYRFHANQRDSLKLKFI